jgi:hypothetical protein
MMRNGRIASVPIASVKNVPKLFSGKVVFVPQVIENPADLIVNA